MKHVKLLSIGVAIAATATAVAALKPGDLARARFEKFKSLAGE